jgi:hypothetical protein
MSSNKINFSKTSSFPNIKKGLISSITFDTCNKPLSINLCKVMLTNIENGIVRDGWWVISSHPLPDRYVRLSKGKESLERLLYNYGFMDNDLCVHYKSGKLTLIGNLKELEEKEVKIPRSAQNVIGIPQRTSNSGICWYAATCHAFFYCTELKEFIKTKTTDNVFKKMIDTCLESPSASEDLRKKLWNDFSFGDDVNQNPELDGQNGLSQFCILASKLDIPMYRFFIDEENTIKMSDAVKDQKKQLCNIRDTANSKEGILLVVRFYRGNHHSKHIPARKIMYKGRKFSLVSILMGSMDCGHQISAATRTVSRSESWRKWAITDSDASRYGIGPVHFKITDKESINKEKWWSNWRYMVPVTMFGNNRMCDLSPQNHPTKSLENMQSSFRGSSSVRDNNIVGDLNADFIYFAPPQI